MSVSSFVRRPIFLALLALGVVLVVAAACGDDDGGDAPADAETPAAGETPAGAETPTAGETPAAGGATAQIKMVPSIKFDRAQLTIAAGADVTITADNTDSGIQHNFAVYTADPGKGGELLGQTEICTAPCVDTVTLNLAAGEYFFRCEVHPSIMMGELIAE